MEYILVIAIIFMILFLMPKDKLPSNSVSDKLVIQKKQCPPHEWFWQEIVDQNGNKQGQRIVCKVCGPLQGQSGREENES